LDGTNPLVVPEFKKLGGSGPHDCCAYGIYNKLVQVGSFLA